MGTSSIFAVTLLDGLLAQCGQPLQQRKATLKALVGTHAHEMSSAMQQLLYQYDLWAGQLCGRTNPICVSAVLTHLLFLAANGGMEQATALADTFTTKAFIAVALEASVPEAFRHDMAAKFQYFGIHPSALCFDLFKVWRIDSGDYGEISEMIMTAWDRR